MYEKIYNNLQHKLCIYCLPSLKSIDLNSRYFELCWVKFDAEFVHDLKYAYAFQELAVETAVFLMLLK
ncbi:hypothetical protein BpHYR1_043926 [Brachionus plicatilis]|uniref:Uncharacterized protein n=1 Tax=Brachionus plicatilis TaxID=10195 RepID=A0A3M7RAH4_BRAPC|nr:hypothetical protein BpHYR1_043926 [Brachionus plicatilis]